MALAGRIIQINLNHSARAHDLLMQTMAELGIGLAAVAEPYKVPENLNCVEDLTRTAAIFRAGTNASPTLQMIERGRGFIAAFWGSTVVCTLCTRPQMHPSNLC